MQTRQAALATLATALIFVWVARANGDQLIVEAQPGVVIEATEVTVVMQEDVPLQRVDAPADDTQGAEKDEEKPEDAKPTEAELRERLNELEQEVREARNTLQRQLADQRQEAEAAGRELIEQSELHEEPTREQCVAFIAELRTATEGRRSFSSADPVVDKLKQVPREHIDLLVAEMANGTSLRYYANYAMRGIDPESIRDQFVSTLDENPNNIGVIVMNGWCEDVRPVIIHHIESADSSLTPAWFQAAVEVADPGLYPKLHEITTGSRYASQFITMLQALPDYDLSHTVNACWNLAGEGKLPVSQATFAPFAAERGNVDALGTMIAQLANASSYMVSASSYNLRRVQVLQLIEYRGSNNQLQAWFDEHRDELVFDYHSRRFVLPQPFEAE